MSTTRYCSFKWDAGCRPATDPGGPFTIHHQLITSYTMGRSGRVWEFVNRNLVTIVMVPSIILIHWGWTKLQDVETLVSKEERVDLPIVIGFRRLFEKVLGENNGKNAQKED
ncbi:hypothetical protein R5R35_000615 [Gryllus longicercus]|uniref:Uncharacterized protein n=1 Tax=Gryllus longicercus TaxID=2509291 RepID=A0AAN9VSW7_9ORTH